jgi:Mrp family chromosome partitioning ATPase
VILVIHAGQTPQEIIRKAVIQLNRSGSCVLGAAVNQVDLTNPEYSYYHKYYYGDKYVVPPKS